jgi:pullulanase/glycogen debranching enzyme
MAMIWRELKYEPQSGDPRKRERQPDEVKFDEELFGFYKRAIALRREHAALNHGEFNLVSTDDVQRSMVFSRRSKKENLFIALNRGDKEAHIDLPLSSAKFTPIFITQGETDTIKTRPSAAGIEVTVPALTGVVFRSE